MADNIFLVSTRVYIAGILMPTTTVNITSAIDKPPTAEILLPPRHELLDIGRYDRVPVQVFQKDTYGGSGDYILLFDGFITNSHYENSISMRAVHISAIGIMDILSDARCNFIHNFDEYVAYNTPGQAEMSTSSTSFLPMPAMFLVKGLGMSNGKGRTTDDAIEFPSDYLQNVFYYLQGANTDQEKSTAGPENSSVLSQFFSHYAESIRLCDRFARLPLFDEENADLGEAAKSLNLDALWGKDKDTHNIFPILKAAQNATIVKSLILKQYESAPQTVETCRSLIDGLTTDLEYEFANFSTPAFIKTGDVLMSNWKNYTYDTHDKLVSCALKPILTGSIPPLCNVIFRSQVIRLEANSAHKEIPTRVQVHDVSSPQACFLQPNSEIWKRFYKQLYPSDYSRKTTKVTSSADLAERPAPDDDINRNVQLVAAYILKTEDWTGPWVATVGTPTWWRWITYNKPTNEDDITLNEIFLHHQLLDARNMKRTVSADITYNPYVTPGFPGVIFDADDTNISFAGYVTVVSHIISPTVMTTNVNMVYARSCAEAAAVYITHPIKVLDYIYHNADCMSKIYNMLLGTGNKISAPSGCTAVDYNAVLNTYGPGVSDTDTSKSPQNNPKVAYEKQKRSICTFDDYCSFMSLAAVNGKGPEGDKTPMELKGDYVEDRAPLYLFNVVESGKKIGDISISENDYVTTESGMTAKEALSTDNKEAQEELEARTLTDTWGYKSNDYAKNITQETDLRKVLKQVAKEEFSHTIYA